MPDTDIRQPIRIGMLMIDGFALMSYAAFIEPFRAANVLAGAKFYDWVHVALADNEMRASNGARLIADQQIVDPIAVDILLVFAAGDPTAFRDEACFAWLRTQARRGIPIGGVSGGPYLLARAGLLGRRRATIHWEHAAALQAEFPDLSIEPGLYLIDDDRMTCAGGTAALDLALALIERAQGGALARKVSEWFIQADARHATEPQRTDLATRHGTSDRRLIAMLTAMEAAVEEPSPRTALAIRAGISLRQLERLCQSELGTSIGDVYMALRLDRAMEMLRATGMSVTEVAMACGFRSVAHFSRRFRQQHGRTPVAARRNRHG